MGQHDDGLDDLAILASVVHLADEGAVDLQGIDGELLEIAQGRMAGAEVVDADPDAQLAESCQHGGGRLRVAP